MAEQDLLGDLVIDNRDDGNDSSDNESQDSQTFIVEKIVSKKIERGIVKYRIRWKNYPPSEDTWEPIQNLENCLELVNEFEAVESAKKKQPRASKHGSYYMGPAPPLKDGDFWKQADLGTLEVDKNVTICDKVKSRKKHRQNGSLNGNLLSESVLLSDVFAADSDSSSSNCSDKEETRKSSSRAVEDIKKVQKKRPLSKSKSFDVGNEVGKRFLRVGDQRNDDLKQSTPSLKLKLKLNNNNDKDRSAQKLSFINNGKIDNSETTKSAKDGGAYSSLTTNIDSVVASTSCANVPKQKTKRVDAPIDFGEAPKVGAKKEPKIPAASSNGSNLKRKLTATVAPQIKVANSKNWISCNQRKSSLADNHLSASVDETDNDKDAFFDLTASDTDNTVATDIYSTERRAIRQEISNLQSLYKDEYGSLETEEERTMVAAIQKLYNCEKLKWQVKRFNTFFHPPDYLPSDEEKQIFSKKLQRAVKKHDKSTVKTMLCQYRLCELGVEDCVNGKSLLWKCCNVACDSNHTTCDIMQMLVKCGADPNIGDPASGETPLAVARKNGYDCKVKLLSSLGATEEHLNNNGIKSTVSIPAV